MISTNFLFFDPTVLIRTNISLSRLVSLSSEQSKILCIKQYNQNLKHNIKQYKSKINQSKNLVSTVIFAIQIIYDGLFIVRSS